MTTQAQPFDGYETDEQFEFKTGSGLRGITLLNPDTAKNGIEIPPEFGGGVLGLGGFSARVSVNPWRFGIEARVPHGNSMDTEIVSRVLRDVVILGWAPNHLVLEGFPSGKPDEYRAQIVHDYAELPEVIDGIPIKKEPFSMKVRTELVLYLVFLADPELNVHRLTIRGNATKDSAAVQSIVKRAAERVSGIITKAKGRGVNVGMHAIRLNLGVAKQRTAGEGNKTGQITPLICDLSTLDDKQLMERVVPAETYQKLHELVRIVKTDIVDGTDWKGPSLPDMISGNKVLQLEAPAENQAPPEEENYWGNTATEPEPETVVAPHQTIADLYADTVEMMEWVTANHYTIKGIVKVLGALDQCKLTVAEAQAKIAAATQIPF